MANNTNERKLIEVFTSFEGGKAQLPLMIKKASQKGPRVFLVGVVHGEEVVGIEVIHRIFDGVKLKRGSIHAIPVANMAGFSMGTRAVPYGESGDWINLNRAFPGDVNGRPGDKIAAAIYKTIVDAKPNLVIDIHADSHNSLPFILLDRFIEKPDAKLFKKTEEFAEAFGVTVCNDDDSESYATDGGESTLSGALFNRERLPAFTVELGGPMVINEPFVLSGVAGIRNILVKLNMLEDVVEPVVDSSKIQPGFRLRTMTVPAKETSGKIRYQAKVGDMVEKGQLLVTISDVFGRKQEEIHSPSDGFVISLGYQAISFPGMTLAILAVKDK
ncbi:MAG: succinylglutamate desuccinylase/aspartoacylase family protein [bacterium]|nr:succinylglutamate desuccinylase/aspartoacylase family protein [bacterium]